MDLAVYMYTYIYTHMCVRDNRDMCNSCKKLRIVQKAKASKLTYS